MDIEVKLSEQDVQEIIKKHVKAETGMDVKRVEIKVGKEQRGFQQEYEVAIFKGVTVHLRSVKGLNTEVNELR